jgi:hypothetical protein
MGWEDLLAPEGGEQKTLPWLGDKKVHGYGRTWTIKGKRPKQHGWYVFDVSGRKATLVGPAEDAPHDFEEHHPTLLGYLAGSRFIPDDARVDPDPDKLIDQTDNAHCIEPGLERFVRVLVAKTGNHDLIYIRQEFPQGPEFDVTAAYQDRRDSVDHIKGVTPALDLCFRWESLQRLKAEEWEREMERIRLEEVAAAEAEERLRQAMRDSGTGAGRRELAKRDFKAAATAALGVLGAELLDYRQGRHASEMIVQYQFMNRRLECVCHRDTLRIIDAGVCLDNHRGTKGDTRFTLESLPSVIKEAIDGRKLVVWRHVAGDPGYYEDDDPYGDEGW